tara:strand:- start:285 stop:473 length:189 start_codon:yes stop_codon:yes gene_type:complete
MTYYEKNKELILLKNQKKKEELKKLNKECKVKNYPGRAGYKWKGEKIKTMKISSGRFIVSFN